MVLEVKDRETKLNLAHVVLVKGERASVPRSPEIIWDQA